MLPTVRTKCGDASAAEQPAIMGSQACRPQGGGNPSRPARGGLDNRCTMRRNGGVAVGVAALCAACSPALDWRELRPADSGLSVLLPCMPASHARRVNLGPDVVRLELHACTAGGVTWAVAFADVQDPARVGPALTELRAAAADNLAAAPAQPLELKVEGATPNPASQRVQFQGRMPDGRAVTEQVAVFAKGTRVFQAVALGDKLDREAVDSFFASLRFVP